MGDACAKVLSLGIISNKKSKTWREWSLVPFKHMHGAIQLLDRVWYYCLIPCPLVLFPPNMTFAAAHLHTSPFTCIYQQECWGLLAPDGPSDLTAVAVGLAKLGDPAVLLKAAKSGGGFVASGKAPSVAAGRLSYIHALKVFPRLSPIFLLLLAVHS